jgi:hypothetical protein
MQVLLVVVNVEQCRFLLRELNMYCYRSGWTLLLAYSVEEAAEYLELLKVAEKRANDVVVVAKKKAARAASEDPSLRGQAYRALPPSRELLADVRDGDRVPHRVPFHLPDGRGTPDRHIRFIEGDRGMRRRATVSVSRSRPDQGAQSRQRFSHALR